MVALYASYKAANVAETKVGGLLMVDNMKAIQVDNNYREWVAELSQRYQKCQIKAASSVNREMLLFYWSLGRDVAQMKAESRWGSGFLR